MTSDHDGRKLALELEAALPGAPVDVARIAGTLRGLANRMEAALKAANDLSESMDVVHRDRVMLASRVDKLIAERENHQRSPAPA